MNFNTYNTDNYIFKRYFVFIQTVLNTRTKTIIYISYDLYDLVVTDGRIEIPLTG